MSRSKNKMQAHKGKGSPDQGLPFNRSARRRGMGGWSNSVRVKAAYLRDYIGVDWNAAKRAIVEIKVSSHPFAGAT